MTKFFLCTQSIYLKIKSNDKFPLLIDSGLDALTLIEVPSETKHPMYWTSDTHKNNKDFYQLTLDSGIHFIEDSDLKYYSVGIYQFAECPTYYNITEFFNYDDAIKAINQKKKDGDRVVIYRLRNIIECLPEYILSDINNNLVEYKFSDINNIIMEYCYSGKLEWDCDFENAERYKSDLFNIAGLLINDIKKK